MAITSKNIRITIIESQTNFWIRVVSALIPRLKKIERINTITKAQIMIHTFQISAISLSDNTSHPLNNRFVIFGQNSRSWRIRCGLRSACGSDHSSSACKFLNISGHGCPTGSYVAMLERARFLSSGHDFPIPGTNANYIIHPHKTDKFPNWT